jgi:hypothetical protein
MKTPRQICLTFDKMMNVQSIFVINFLTASGKSLDIAFAWYILD